MITLTEEEARQVLSALESGLFSRMFTHKTQNIQAAIKLLEDKINEN